MGILEIWIAILALSVFMYVVLDGFDLGVGILFPLFSDENDRDHMIHAIAPVWDGNETWLIFTGVCLFAIFPTAYATLLPALYIPVIAMLLGLVFRGVAFEFREAEGRWKTIWDSAFHIASVLVAAMQGIILGSLIQGVDIQATSQAGTASSAWFAWLTPFTLLTAVSVVIGYALMGASWLIIKTEGDLHNSAKKAAKISLAITFVALIVISLWTPFLHPDYYQKWFGGSVIGTTMMLVIPLISIIATAIILFGLKNNREALPFWGSILLFASGYLGVLFNLYPNIVPPSLSFEAAAAPMSSLQFLLPGTLILLPIVGGYFVYSHWVFRGKVVVREGD